MSNSRAKTVDEVRQEFLQYIHEVSNYWATRPDKTVQERCDGVAFSILNIFDGATSLPAMDIRLVPHPEDKEFHQQNGENWYEPGMVINDCQLHDLWHEKKGG